MAPLGSCGVMAWGCPEQHPCIHWGYEGYGEGHPRTEQKAAGMAFYIPNPNLSTVDLTWWLEKTAKDNDIEMVKKQVSEDPLKDLELHWGPEYLLWL